MEKSIKYEGFSFNTEWISGFKTEAEFIANPKNKSRWKQNNEAKLKELYAMVNGKPEKVKVEQKEK
jgi:hypothetical protein